MTSDGGTVARQLSKVLGKITEKKASGQEISDCLGELFLRVHSQFPGDVGCFCIYFLNHVTLQPGQAMFLGPNLPHAYLYGGEVKFEIVWISLWWAPSGPTGTNVCHAELEPCPTSCRPYICNNVYVCVCMCACNYAFQTDRETDNTHNIIIVHLLFYYIFPLGLFKDDCITKHYLLFWTHNFW